MHGTLIIYLLIAKAIGVDGPTYTKVTLKKYHIVNSIDEAKELVNDFIRANHQIHDSGVVSYEYQPFPIQIYPDKHATLGVKLKQRLENHRDKPDQAS